ncbi:hypothetical protein [Blastococcus sp. SYSU D01042]
MALTKSSESEPARKMAILGAGIELAAIRGVEGSDSILAEPYHEGRPGKLMQAAKACTTRPRLAVLGGHRRWGAVPSEALLAVGSLLTRSGVFQAGIDST